MIGPIEDSEEEDKYHGSDDDDGDDEKMYCSDDNDDHMSKAARDSESDSDSGVECSDLLWVARSTRGLNALAEMEDWDVKAGWQCGTRPGAKCWIIYCRKEAIDKDWGWRYVVQPASSSRRVFDDVVELLNWYSTLNMAPERWELPDLYRAGVTALRAIIFCLITGTCLSTSLHSISKIAFDPEHWPMISMPCHQCVIDQCDKQNPQKHHA